MHITTQTEIYEKVCYRFRVLDKDLRASHLVLVVIHVDRPQEVKDPLLFRTPPTGPCLSCQNGIPGYKYTHNNQRSHCGQWVLAFRKCTGLNSPHQKLAEDSSVCKSSPSYTYVFPQSQVFNLMLDPTNRWNTTIHLKDLAIYLGTCVNVCHSEDANLLSSQSFGRFVSLGLIQRI